MSVVKMPGESVAIVGCLPAGVKPKPGDFVLHLGADAPMEILKHDESVELSAGFGVPQTGLQSTPDGVQAPVCKAVRLIEVSDPPTCPSHLVIEGAHATPPNCPSQTTHGETAR